MKHWWRLLTGPAFLAFGIRYDDNILLVVSGMMMGGDLVALLNGQRPGRRGPWWNEPRPARKEGPPSDG